jgi:hypothetical protein
MKTSSSFETSSNSYQTTWRHKPEDGNLNAQSNQKPTNITIHNLLSSGSVCQVACSWVDVGSFHMRLVARFMNFTASVRNILDNLSCLPTGVNSAAVGGLLTSGACDSSKISQWLPAESSPTPPMVVT